MSHQRKDDFELWAWCSWAVSQGAQVGRWEHCHGIKGDFSPAWFGPASRVTRTVMLAQPSLSVGAQSILD